MKIVVVDTAQIQPYVFGSNRLRENIGASHLVAQATGQWALEEVIHVEPSHNVKDAATGKLDSSVNIEQGQVKAQVIYTGGGNVVVVFSDDNGQAEKFVRNFSRRLLRDAPNLQIVVTAGDFQPGQSLAQAVQRTFLQLLRVKRERSFAPPPPGLGVTVMCKSTGLPAVAKTQPTVKSEPDTAYEASTEIHAKLRAAWPRDTEPSLADEALQSFLDLPERYVCPRDFDDLGREAGEDSHIAVIHADGNGMGQLFQDVGDKYTSPKQNEDYIQAVYALSEQVKEASKAALQTVGKQLIERMEKDTGHAINHYNAWGELLADVVLQERDGKQLIPFRPLVFGGDDLTFVCDGRLGLSLAIMYLQQFEEQTEKIVGKRLTACAGVAIVKSRYPFAVAYQLADDLCASAKRYRHRASLGGSCLDWHFALSDVSGKPEEIRQREYIVGRDRYLHLRPVALNGQNGSGDEFKAYRRWETVREGIDEFQDLRRSKDSRRNKPEWSTKRNKVKALREALRQGEAAVQRFCIQYGLQLPKLAHVSSVDYQKTGWQDSHCLYFDAIELMDWFIPLEIPQVDGEEEEIADE